MTPTPKFPILGARAQARPRPLAATRTTWHLKCKVAFIRRNWSSAVSSLVRSRPVAASPRSSVLIELEDWMTAMDPQMVRVLDQRAVDLVKGLDSTPDNEFDGLGWFISPANAGMRGASNCQCRPVLVFFPAPQIASCDRKSSFDASHPTSVPRFPYIAALSDVMLY